MAEDMAAITRFASSLADDARLLAVQHFRKTTSFELKADESPVTVADRAIEAALRSAIEREYPGHGIYGEEMGLSPAGESGKTWVLDPIDGTKSFVTGYPLFGTLIAFADQGTPVVGIIEMPILGERWIGDGEVTRFGDAPVRVSGCERLEEARIYTSSPDSFSASDWSAYDRLSRGAAIRRFGGDCYLCGLLASGFIDVVVECSMMPYDFMATVPVVENAGGVITDWEGRPLTIGSGPRTVATSSRRLHTQVLSVLNGLDSP